MRTVSSSLQKALLVLLVTGHAHVASADPLPNGGEVVFEYIHIRENGGDLEIPTDDDALRMYFNKAHCVCGQNDSGDETTFGVEIKMEGGTGDLNRPAEIWYGSQCDVDQQRPDTCVREDAAGIADLDTIALESTIKELSVFRLMEPVGETCTDRELESSVWVIADADADGTYDYFVAAGITTDSQPPPVPTVKRAEGAESAIQLTWDAPTERIEDVHMYQAFCVGADGRPALATDNRPKAGFYKTVRGLCGLDINEVIFTPTTLQGLPAGLDTIPTPIAQLNEEYLCGSATSSATGMRIEGLENDADYQIALISIDKAGNAAGVYIANTLTPVPAVDFWEDLNDRGSKVEGGVCLISTVFGDDSGISNGLRQFRDRTLASSAAGQWLTARYYDVFGDAAWASPWTMRVVLAIVLLPVIALALLWNAIGWPWLLLAAAAWLGRKQLATWLAVLRPSQAARALSILLAAGVVSQAAPSAAQSNQPYWDASAPRDDAAEDDVGVDPVTWRIGLKIGPYFPGIDKQFGSEPGPFEDMFGDGGVLPALDVERIIFRRAGHLAIAGNIGWYSRTNRAWLIDSVPGDPNRGHSKSDTSTFSMIPASIGLSYRLTQLHEHWKMPLVPYVRGGLAYYLWWVKGPDGKVARVEGEDDKALGASLGLVGAIGISLRLEWLDKDAMYSMRESGTRHAGIYAEIQGGKVDGFGSETKLSVGDTTWFAGVDFEF